MLKKFDEYTILPKHGESDNGPESFDFGGCADVYLAKNEKEIEKGIKKLYVLKILKKDKTINEHQQQAFDKEIDTLLILKNVRDSEKYIPLIYRNQKYNCEKQNNNEKGTENQKELNPFYAIDYISNNCLCYYLSLVHFEENEEIKLTTKLTTKLLFKKIVEAVKFLHDNNICHLDLKPDNIMLDKDFNPIIIDFGSVEKLEPEIKRKIFEDNEKNITLQYACPELFDEKKEYIDGEKYDCFSLGAILFKLVTGEFGFNDTINDELYNYIRNGNHGKYWEEIKEQIETKNGNKLNISDEFKELYLSMVHPDPTKRKSIEEILGSGWFKDLETKDVKEKEKLEKIYKDEFTNIFNSIKDKHKSFKISEEKLSEGFLMRSLEDKEYTLFTEKIKNLIPKKISNDEIQINPCIKINSDLSAFDIMNYLLLKILEFFQDECIPYEDEYVFEVFFNKNKKIGSCTMKIELFKYEEKGKYLLEFMRKEGTIEVYYHYFLEIKKMISQNL